MTEQRGPFWSIYQDLKAGHISRREFITRATALGVGLPVTLFVLNSINVEGVAAQDAAPAARPSVGTEGQTRGEGGEVKLIQWQAATHAFIHVNTGTKDALAASLVSEPLVSFMPDATMIPNLVKEIPTVENGLLAADFSSVTYNLLEGVLWSDGEPFTADDVVWTWQWITDESNQSVNFTLYAPISSIEAITPTQVKISFTEPTLSWYIPFAGSYAGGVIPKHVWEGQDKEAVNLEFRKNPIGTGPFKIDSLKENDQIIYSANENYREANKPFFASVNLKGGGDAASAAQAVLQTGDWDYAWNPQVEPQILKEMEAAGKGTLHATPATSVERLMLNQTDPDQEVDGQRSEMNTPHPYLTDKTVRQALSLAADRETISTQFYLGGDLEPAGKNILSGMAKFDSPNTTTEFNLDKANEVLEAAGWVKDGNTRKKDGVELKMEYATTINAVRQKVQAVNKQNFEAIGFKVQLVQVDAGVFFNSAAGDEQTVSHFYRDIQMYTDGPTNPSPLLYMQTYYSGPDRVNLAQKSNGWAGTNTPRYVNPDYDEQYLTAQNATDPEVAAAAFIAMNDIVILDYAVIPLVSRAAETYCISNRLQQENVAASAWETSYWNIVNWRTA